jgi:hypothetical protein
MKCGIEIIVGVILRKPVIKVEIEAFLIVTLTLTAGDSLKAYIVISFAETSNLGFILDFRTIRRQ